MQVIDPRDMDTSEFGTESTLRRDLDIKTKGRMVNTIISKYGRFDIGRGFLPLYFLIGGLTRC